MAGALAKDGASEAGAGATKLQAAQARAKVPRLPPVTFSRDERPSGEAAWSAQALLLLHLRSALPFWAAAGARSRGPPAHDHRSLSR